MTREEKEIEIRQCFARMEVPLAQQGIFGDKRWCGNSQYGYTLTGPFSTQEEAEESVVQYYSDKMNLILQ